MIVFMIIYLLSYVWSKCYVNVLQNVYVTSCESLLDKVFFFLGILERHREKGNFFERVRRWWTHWRLVVSSWFFFLFQFNEGKKFQRWSWTIKKKGLEKMNCEGPAKKETFESRISQKKVTVLLIFFLALCCNKPKKSFTFVKLMYLYT